MPYALQLERHAVCKASDNAERKVPPGVHADAEHGVHPQVAAALSTKPAGLIEAQKSFRVVKLAHLGSTPC